MVKNPPAHTGDTGSIPGPRRSRVPWCYSALVPMKGEADRAGLRLRPGCEHQATHMITLPVDSELWA